MPPDVQHPAGPSRDESLDEVALNALLAEGIDLPTAWEASRILPGNENPDKRPEPASWATVAILLFVALVVALCLLLA